VRRANFLVLASESLDWAKVSNQLSTKSQDKKGTGYFNEMGKLKYQELQEVYLKVLLNMLNIKWKRIIGKKPQR